MEDYKFECICGKKYKSQGGLAGHGTKSHRGINDGRGCPEYQERKAQNKLVNVFGLKDEKSVVINNNITKTINNNNDNNDNHDNDNVNVYQGSNTVNNNYKVKFEEISKRYKNLEETNKMNCENMQRAFEYEKEANNENEKKDREIECFKNLIAKKDRELLNYERLLGKHNIPF